MNVKLFSLTSTMESLNVPLDERAQLLTTALARALSYRLAIPAAPVADPKLYYYDTYKAQIESVLAKINERMVIDIDTITAQVGGIWLFRYRLAHDQNNMGVREYCDSLLKVGSKEFPGAVSEGMIRQSHDGLMDRVARAVDASLVPAEGV